MLTDKQRQLVESAPESMQGFFLDSFEGTAYPRRAIKAMCLSCCNFDRKEVRQCTVITCSLHLYRPYIKRDDPHSDAVGGDVDGQANDVEE